MDFSLWNGSAELLYTFLLFKFAATAALAMSQSIWDALSRNDYSLKVYCCFKDSLIEILLLLKS